jgi:hypothetical protein
MDIGALPVGRPPRRAIYLPFEFITDVIDDGIVLSVSAEQVRDMHWWHAFIQ